MISRVISVIQNGLRNSVTVTNENITNNIRPLFIVEMNTFHCM